MQRKSSIQKHVVFQQLQLLHTHGAISQMQKEDRSLKLTTSYHYRVIPIDEISKDNSAPRNPRRFLAGMFFRHLA